MKKENIFDIAKKSSIQLLENPVLLAPLLFSLLLLMVGVLGVVLALLVAGFSFNFDAATLPGFIILPSLGGIIAAAGIILVISLAIILAMVYIHAGLLGMIKEVVQNKKTSLGAINRYGQKFWGRYLGVNVMVSLISLTFFVLVLLFNLLFNYLFERFFVLLMIIDAILIILFILFIILFSLSQYYLVLENLSVMGAIKKGYHVVKRNYFEFIALIFIFVIATSLLGRVPFVGFILNLIIGTIQSIALMNFAVNRK